jgi:hypothetical protein
MLTKKQLLFLKSLNQNRERKVSVLKIGKQFFKTPNGIYLILEKFRVLKLTNMEKGDKEIKITLTKKGLQYISNKNEGLVRSCH